MDRTIGGQHAVRGISTRYSRPPRLQHSLPAPGSVRDAVTSRRPTDKVPRGEHPETSDLEHRGSGVMESVGRHRRNLSSTGGSITSPGYKRLGPNPPGQSEGILASVTPGSHYFNSNAPQNVPEVDGSVSPNIRQHGVGPVVRRHLSFGERSQIPPRQGMSPPRFRRSGRAVTRPRFGQRTSNKRVNGRLPSRADARPDIRVPEFPFPEPRDTSMDSPHDLQQGWNISSPPQSEVSALSHISADGQVSMVDISAKAETIRVAVAVGTVIFSKSETLEKISSNSLSKGNVLTTATLAGIQAAKRTADIIPLCHNIPLSKVHVEIAPFYMGTAKQDSKYRAKIVAVVNTRGATGVEMEALTAVTGAALTVVDMCKAVDKQQVIRNVYVIYKSGGRSGTYQREERGVVEQLTDLKDRGLLPATCEIIGKAE